MYADAWHINQILVYKQVNLRTDGQSPQSINDLGVEVSMASDFVVVKKTMI